MKYWYVFFDKIKNQYQIEMSERLALSTKYIAVFVSFDMAYDYVTKANRTSDTPAYSRWTVRA